MKTPKDYYHLLDSINDDIIRDFKEFVKSTGRNTLWVDKSITEEYPVSSDYSYDSDESYETIWDKMTEDAYPFSSHYTERHCGEIINGVVYGVHIDQYGCLNAIFSAEYDSSIEEVNIYNFDLTEVRWLYDRFYSTYNN